MECEYFGTGVWMCTPENDKGTVPKCVEKCERSHLQDWSKRERSHFNQIPSDEHTRGGSSEGVGIGHKCCWSVIKVFTNTYMYFGMAERRQLILWYNANYSNSHSFWMAATGGNESIWREPSRSLPWRNSWRMIYVRIGYVTNELLSWLCMTHSFIKRL